jgi:electron transfer flavoprotein alpha subunit
MPDPVDIMLVAACAHGRILPEDDDLIAFGHALQKLGAGAMGIWVLGDRMDKVAGALARRTGVRVTAIQGAGLADYLNETHASVMIREIEAVMPRYVCTAHTSRGWDWAPMVAAKLGADCITAVDGLTVCQDKICFQRDLYGGKVKGLYPSGATITVLTVQPGIFKLEPAAESHAGSVALKSWEAQPERTRFRGYKQAAGNTSDITAAPVIVAAGNGIGEQDNMALIHRLAELLPKASVAGSRIVCDRGWLAYNRQVGVTGATVSPALYIACGISGASQHVLGMRGAKFVVAINTDPRAPIFNEADVCIVEDVVSFIPLVAEALLRLAANIEQSPKE